MHSGLERLHAGYAQVLTGLSAKTLEGHPAGDPACWNARQIVEHLILTYQSSLAAFSQRLAKDRPTKLQPEPYQQIQQLFVCRFGYFPAGRTAPSAVAPTPNPIEPRDGSTLAVELRSSLQSMDEILDVCEERFGTKRFATHHVLGPLSAQQWRAFHVAHGRRHLKQLRRLDFVRLTKEADIPREN